MAGVAQHAVNSKRDDIQDGKANYDIEDQDNVECPNVCETTLTGVNIYIEAMTRDILALQPPSLIEQATTFNINSSSTYRGPHFAKCGHEIKGHRKVTETTKLCSTCP